MNTKEKLKVRRKREARQKQLNKKNNQVSLPKSMSKQLVNELENSIMFESCLATDNLDQLKEVVKDSSEFLFDYFENIHTSIINQLNFKQNLNSEIAALTAMFNELHISVEDVDLNNFDYNELFDNCESDRFEMQKCKCVNYIQIINNVLYDIKYNKIRNDNDAKLKILARYEKLKEINNNVEEDTL